MKQKKESSKIYNKWIRTNDKWGLKAMFDVICPHCNEKMFVRNSELSLPRNNYVGRIRVKPTLTVMYKCVPCAVVFWFYIDSPYIDLEYWNKVLELRNMHPLWIPPTESWSEDARVQQRLKDLGYLGGDVEYKDVTDIEEK